MVLEATMICIDNSEWMRNGDYSPSRFQAHADAVNLLCGAKTQSNPENTVGILTMAGKQVRVLTTLTSDLGKILSCMHAAITEQPKRMGYSYEDKVYERRDAKSSKDPASTRSDTYGPHIQSPYHDSPVDTLRGRASPFGVGQIPHARLLSQQDKSGHVFLSPQRDDDYLLQQDTFTNNRTSAQSMSHPIMGPENSNVFSDAQTFHNDTELQLEKTLSIYGKKGRFEEILGSKLCHHTLQQACFLRWFENVQSLVSDCFLSVKYVYLFNSENSIFKFVI